MKLKFTLIDYLIIILVICAILSLTFGYLSGRFAAIASTGFAKNLRHDMYYKIQDYSFYNIDKFKTFFTRSSPLFETFPGTYAHQPASGIPQNCGQVPE